jgi:uncharacterized RDD family membrane protein YckC
MQTTNPLAPAAPSVEAASTDRSPPQLQYAGFWRRFAAYWIDLLVWLPLIGITYLLGETTRLFYLYWFVPGLLISLWFDVYLVKRYGGTPGKLLLKTRIAMRDGSPITVKAASIRFAVLLVLGELGAIAIITSTLTMTNEMYFSLGYMARMQKLVELAPPWYATVNVLTQVWVFSEFITMLFNKKRRAVHDFIAGTVVVRS